MKYVAHSYLLDNSPAQKQYEFIVVWFTAVSFPLNIHFALIRGEKIVSQNSCSFKKHQMNPTILPVPTYIH